MEPRERNESSMEVKDLGMPIGHEKVDELGEDALEFSVPKVQYTMQKAIEQICGNVPA